MLFIYFQWDYSYFFSAIADCYFLLWGFSMTKSNHPKTKQTSLLMITWITEFFFPVPRWPSSDFRSPAGDDTPPEEVLDLEPELFDDTAPRSQTNEVRRTKSDGKSWEAMGSPWCVCLFLGNIRNIMKYHTNEYRKVEKQM
jgi:hypothetical protein